MCTKISLNKIQEWEKLNIIILQINTTENLIRPY